MKLQRWPLWIRIVAAALVWAVGMFIIIPTGPRTVVTAAAALASGLIFASAMALATRRYERRKAGRSGPD